MKKTIKRITPLRLGILFAVITGTITLPFALFFALFGFGFVTLDRTPLLIWLGSGMMAIAGALTYALIGFFTGVISAAIYNLITPWLGGIEVEIE